MQWVTVARGAEGQSSTFIHHQIRPPRCNEGKLVQEKGQLPGTERGGGPSCLADSFAVQPIRVDGFESVGQR